MPFFFIYLLDHCNDILPKYDPKEDRYQTKDITGKYIESPVRISTIVSRAKEEKVVKPPKRPVNRKALVLIEKL